VDASGALHAGQRVHRDEVRLDHPGDVAHDLAAAGVEEHAQLRDEARDVLSIDASADA
jgi:hypothetical protein